MTFDSSYQVATLEPAAMGVNDDGQAKPQTIVVGPVAAFESIKMLGTNGGGFYGMNSAHPFENPTAERPIRGCIFLAAWKRSCKNCFRRAM